MDTATTPPLETLSSSGVTPVIPAVTPGLPRSTGGPIGKPVINPTRKAQLAEMFRQRADSHGPGAKTASQEDKVHKPKELAKEPAKPAAKPVEKTKEAPEDVGELGFESEPAPEPREEVVAPPEVAEGEKAADKPVKGKGPDPWRLVNTYKAKNKELEAEIAQVKAKIADPEMVTNLTRERDMVKEQNKRLLAHMRFLDYSHHPEYVEKLEKPYVEEWKSGQEYVSKLNVTESDGTTRPGTVEDLTMLANMSVQQPQSALTKAREMFGDIGDRVLARAEKIIELDEKRNRALATARKESEEQGQSRQQSRQQRDQEIGELFTRFNDQQFKEQEFLRPVEGDAEFNEKLATAKAYVEKALKTRLLDENLSKEELAKAVQRLVTVHNRAIGFTALRLQNKRLKAENAQLKNTNAEFHGAEPGAGTGRKEVGTAPINPKDRMLAAFQKAADRQTFR
jgi:hypothetical protein